MQPSSAPGPATAHRVFRQASVLVLARAVATPLSILLNAIAARAIGPGAFGRYYQALTFASFIFLFVEWGQPNVLIARVAVRPAAAGELLGSAIVSRICAALLAGAAAPLICALAGYDREFEAILGLAMLGGAFMTVAAAYQDALRGLERADLAAASYLGWQLLSTVVSVPTLLLGGGLRGFLVAQAACAAAAALFMWKIAPRLGVSGLSVRWSVIKDLAGAGRSFLVFGLVLMLQPMVDATLLSKLSTPASMGWYAAAGKLVGALLFPASALVTALYPTLCRLRLQDMDEYRSTAADALYAVSIVVVPVALGCALFPDLGVAIFGQRRYGPAADDLRMLAPYLFLVYFSMPIGSCLVSCGRQTAWTLLQFLSVLVNAVLDPLLIGWFQRRGGNGGLGVCVATVASEILVVIGGIWLLPGGILGKIPRRKVSAALVAGAAMILVAVSSAALNLILRALLSTLAYLLCLGLLGGVSLSQLRSLLQIMRRQRPAVAGVLTSTHAAGEDT